MPVYSQSQITDRQLFKLTKHPDQKERADGAVRGLTYRASNGSVSARLSIKFGGVRAKLTIGTYPQTPLVELRRLAQRALGDPRAALASRAVSTVADQTRVIDFATARDEYLTKCAAVNTKAKTYEWQQRLLKTTFASLDGRELLSMTRADVAAILNAYHDRGLVDQHPHSVIRKFFNWCIQRQLCSVSPVTGLTAQRRAETRDRVLADEELRAVLRAARSLPHPIGPLTLLLFMTAQRIGEVAGMSWPEVDLDAGIWTLPYARTKKHRVSTGAKANHVVPLSPDALAVMRSIPRLHETLVFPSRASATAIKSVSGRTVMLTKLQKASGTSGWTFHDLRRTAATLMSERCGVDETVIGRVLNHAPVTVTGKVYNRDQFVPQKREALDKLGAYLLSLESEVLCPG